MESIFGPVISKYTREDMLQTGELIDISKLAAEAGFKIPHVIKDVAITRAAWEGIVVPDKQAKRDGESENGRLWDILQMLVLSVRRGNSVSPVRFDVLASFRGRRQLVNLKAIMGPGDTPQPCITIMLPEEN